MQDKEKITLGEFKIGRTLGQGAFSKVKLGTRIDTNQKVAIKIIDKKLMAESLAKSQKSHKEREAKRNKRQPTNEPPKVEPPKTATDGFISKLENEVQLMMRLDHPNVIKTYQVLDSPDECFVVMDLAEGGELVEYIAAKWKLSENESRKYFRQIVSGLDHIHQANIVHRDLKLENLLLDKDRNVLISDFGLGRTFVGDNQLLKTFCGTPNYAAIELISGIPYIGVKSDIWSLGVILYFMVTGGPPFVGNTIASLYENIKSLNYTIQPYFSDGNYFDSLTSSEMIDLYSRIFVKDPEKRIDMDGLRNHPWTNFDGLSPPDRILPRLTGIVDEKKLGQMINSINYDQQFTVYQFHKFKGAKGQIEIPKKIDPSTKKNIAVVSRKGISLKQDGLDSNSLSLTTSIPESGDDDTNAAPIQRKNSISLPRSMSKRSGRARSATVTAPRATTQVISFTASAEQTKPVCEEPVVIVPNSEEFPKGEVKPSVGLLSVVKPTQAQVRRHRSFTESRKSPSSTISQRGTEKSNNLSFDLASSPENTNDATHANNLSPTKSTDRRPSFFQQRPPVEKRPSVLFPKEEDYDSPDNAFITRLSTVGPTAHIPTSPTNAVTTPQADDISIEVITKFHETHRPPKAIRSMKFALRPGITSSILDPATMFQDIHKALISLASESEDQLQFKRLPDYYIFSCKYEGGNDKEQLMFDIELCKVWLLSIHGIKVTRLQGSGFEFKEVYDRLVKKLNWQKW
ncbi:kinase-like domain-containing protein [Globomyces pollinis-pini]|nr:kinase-like domain-containing protein [Globomyces pollinis-pini]